MADPVVASAHKIIVERAADIANASFPSYREKLKQEGMNESLIRKAAQFIGFGNYFRPQTQNVDAPSIGISVDYNFDSISDVEVRQGIRKIFRKIGEDAIRQSVKENAQQIRVAIITEARAERDYFRLFKDQKQLFDPEDIPLKPKEKKTLSAEEQFLKIVNKTINDSTGDQGQLF